MNYSEKLKNSRWKSKRLKIIERDKECLICAHTENLQVHHTHYVYGKEPWDYEDIDLITLCNNCHLDVEENLDKIKWLLSTLQKRKPYFLIQIIAFLSRNLDETEFNNFKTKKFKHG